MNTRDTSLLEKLIPSIMNALLALLLSSPVFFLIGPGLAWRLSAILIFYIMQVADTHENMHFRCFGMRILGSVWEKKYSRLQRNLYSVLYTLTKPSSIAA